jgi:hypothetical protein
MSSAKKIDSWPIYVLDSPIAFGWPAVSPLMRDQVISSILSSMCGNEVDEHFILRIKLLCEIEPDASYEAIDLLTEICAVFSSIGVFIVVVPAERIRKTLSGRLCRIVDLDDLVDHTRVNNVLHKSGLFPCFDRSLNCLRAVIGKLFASYSGSDEILKVFSTPPADTHIEQADYA